MQIVISREALLKPLTMVSSVVERRHTLPVLANVLLSVEKDQLSVTGTDMEVELVGRTPVDEVKKAGAVTVPARKFLDISRSLADGTMLELTAKDDKLTLKSGRSRYTLATRPATEFPLVEDETDSFSVTVAQPLLGELLDRTGFSMAQQDVRYYLNGMLFEAAADYLRVVATDGHRLAMDTLQMKNEVKDLQQVILPRKGVLELAKLLGEGGDITLTFGKNHIRARMPEFTFTSKLVDGAFPPYQRVLPKGGDKVLSADADTLRQALTRAAILSNEKYHGVRLILSKGEVQIHANNPEQEEAEEAVAVDYSGDDIEMGFNVSYLIDVLTTLSGGRVRVTLSNPDSSALVEPEAAAGAADSSGGDGDEAGDDGDGGAKAPAEGTEALYVIMPMKL